MNFKDIARRKQADYFENHYGITEFATVKRKPRGRTETVDFYVPALLKWEDAKDGKIFHELRKDRENETRASFYERIMKVMAQLGGGSANVL